MKEKDKYLEFIAIYSDMIAENQKAIRAVQLAEIRDLATILSTQEHGYEVEVKGQKNLIGDFKQLLSSPSSKDMTLRDRSNEIYEAIVGFSENSILKEKINAYFEDNQNKSFGEGNSGSN